MRITFNQLLLYFLIWTLVALFDLAGDYFHAYIWEREFNWSEEIPFVTSWYIWFLLTPLAVFAAERWKYSQVALAKFLAVHLMIYAVLNASQILLASWYINLSGQWLDGGPAFRGVLSKTALSGTIYNFLIYAVILMIINTISNYKNLKAAELRSLELENKLAESRMQFLKQQLQPHFLFNTHHSIITLMKLGEREKAIEMMEKMSGLMRFALRESGSQEIPLEKELQLAELYLDIQKIRFEERLEAAISVPETLKQALVPAMILQPLIENSVKYSLESDASACRISISAAKEQDQLVLTVSDSGKAKDVPVKKGIGLTNTGERLQQLYGNSHYFAVSFGEGCRVTIKIPLNYGV